MSLKWLPNALTIARILAAPVIGWLVWQATIPGKAEHLALLATWALVLFILAALTDWLDGYLARRLKVTSALGAMLDLWADKILVAGVLLGALPNFPLMALAGLVFLTARDLLVMYLRARRPDVNLKATWLAKSKTAVVMTGMAIIMLAMTLYFQMAVQTYKPDTAWIRWLLFAGLGLYALGCLASLYTGLQYVRAALQTQKS